MSIFKTLWLILFEKKWEWLFWPQSKCGHNNPEVGFWIILATIRLSTNKYSANNPQGGSVVIRVANLNDSAHPQRLTGPPSCFTHSDALSQQKHVNAAVIDLDVDTYSNLHFIYVFYHSILYLSSVNFARPNEIEQKFTSRSHYGRAHPWW